MRPHSFRCQMGVHLFNEVDDCNRVWCSRCGARKPVQTGPIRESNRVMTRVKTKPGKMLPMSKQKRFVKPDKTEGAKR
jgi:hypothetical protein